MTKFEYSSGAFIYRHGKDGIMFLILKRHNGEHDMPKGHIEKGESAEQAAKREILEETGLSVSLDGFFSETTKYFFYNGRERIAKQVKFFLAEANDEKVKISKEHVGYLWADPDTAAKCLKFKDLLAIIPKAAEYIKRLDQMTELNSEYAMLPKKSRGWDLSARLVPGEGRLDAKVMLLGQAPGAGEDEQLRPFIGRSGRLLDSMLRKARINRKKAYITSMVQFFPPKNRLPTPEEVALCMPFLKRQIAIIRPRYVILLGNLASTSMLGIGEVEKNHGRELTRDGITYMMTFHPAAALRFKDKVGIMETDMKAFAKRING